LAVTPEFHWTDQKIKAHYFSCVLGYLLASVIWREAQKTVGFTGALDTLLDTLLDAGGKSRARRQLEQMSEEQTCVMDALELMDIHKKPIRIKRLSVYN